MYIYLHTIYLRVVCVCVYFWLKRAFQDHVSLCTILNKREIIDLRRFSLSLFIKKREKERKQKQCF